MYILSRRSTANTEAILKPERIFIQCVVKPLASAMRI